MDPGLQTKIKVIKKHSYDVQALCKSINKRLEEISGKVVTLDNMYDKFIKDHNGALFVFGLDSLNFQSHFMQHERANLLNFFNLLINKTYGQYYKLNAIIQEYVSSNLDIKPDQKPEYEDFPKYKCLEPNKFYDFALIERIQQNIFTNIRLMYNFVSAKQKTLKEHEISKNMGLDIHNFISTYEFFISNVEGKINLFLKYTEFLNIKFLKYLKRINQKIRLFYSEIHEDIKIENEKTFEDELSSAGSVSSLDSMPIEKDLTKDLESNLGIVITDETDLDKELSQQNVMDSEDKTANPDENIGLMINDIHEDTGKDDFDWNSELNDDEVDK